jgi:hypothetical protein
MEAAGPPKWWYLSTKLHGVTSQTTIHHKCDIHLLLVSQMINFSVVIFVHAYNDTVTILFSTAFADSDWNSRRGYLTGANKEHGERSGE